MGRYRVTFSSLVQVQLLSKRSKIHHISWFDRDINIKKQSSLTLSKGFVPAHSEKKMYVFKEQDDGG